MRLGVTLLYIAMLAYSTTAAVPTTAPTAPTRTPTFEPTGPTVAPTHGPTNLPSKSPTLFPTITVMDDQDIKIVATVTLQGEEIMQLCSDSNLEEHDMSLDGVFVAASGVSYDDITTVEIKDCENANDEATLTYEMRSTNSRSINTVKERVKSGQFLSTYQENLNLVFNDVQAKSVTILEAQAAEKETDSDEPFDDFFSQYFGLGVVIVVVSLLWLWFLQSEQTEDKERLRNLQNERRDFEAKYGKLEPLTSEDEKQTANMVQMVENTKPTEAASYETQEQETNM